MSDTRFRFIPRPLSWSAPAPTIRQNSPSLSAFEKSFFTLPAPAQCDDSFCDFDPNESDLTESECDEPEQSESESDQGESDQNDSGQDDWEDGSVDEESESDELEHSDSGHSEVTTDEETIYTDAGWPSAGDHQQFKSDLRKCCYMTTSTASIARRYETEGADLNNVYSRLRRAKLEWYNRYQFLHGPNDRKPVFGPMCAVGKPAPILLSLLFLGVRAMDDATRRQHAAALVDLQVWGVEPLVELAQHICWMGTQELAHDRCRGVAEFVRAIHRRFEEFSEPRILLEFTHNLRDCTVGMFNAWWNSDHPHSITKSCWNAVAHVSEALALACLLGELYRVQILRAFDVHDSLNILNEGPPSIEHIYAVNAIIVHSGVQLFHNNHDQVFMEDYVVRFSSRARSVGAMTSLLGEYYCKSEVESWINDLKKMTIVNRVHD